VKYFPTIARAQRRHKSRRRPPLDLRRACALVIAIGLLAACAERQPLLNSERISATYGSYGIEVLEASGSRRTANLYSEQDGQRTMRTYAHVRFVLPVDEALREEHELVVAGGSIGEVFRSRGWTVLKRSLRIGTDLLEASDREIAALMGIDTPREVALYEYALVVGRDGRRIEYAVITERHHPDYLAESDLLAIYGRPPKTAK
jgi:hypothetical protein